jgi:hypothetical protein
MLKSLSPVSEHEEFDSYRIRDIGTQELWDLLKDYVNIYTREEEALCFV